MRQRVSQAAVGANLIAQMRRIVGRRDRTSLNGALVLAARALFKTEQARLARVVSHGGTEFLIPCASMIGDTEEVEDAYLLSPSMGRPLAEAPNHARCCALRQPVRERCGGVQRYFFPLFHHDLPYAVLEIECAAPLYKRGMDLMEQLLGLFIDHLTLIDYAETDTLTGLLNRKTFDENLSRILAKAGDDDAAREGTCSPRRRSADQENVGNWLAVGDIDHFKRVNDGFGHIIGDEVLLLVAQLMRKVFRFDDQLFRFGGEEFVTVLQPTTQTHAVAVLERFRESVASYEFPIVGRVTISLGLTRLDPMDTPTELVGRADQALYHAKRNGRNQVACYEDLVAGGQLPGVPTKPAKPAVELF